MKCKCKTKVECGFYENGICVSTVKCPEQTDATLTNYERIRNMSLEEMAEMMDKFDCSGGVLDKICTAVNPEQNCDTENCNCINCIKQWLESEVKDNEQ